jgi:hypothetical protein
LHVSRGPSAHTNRNEGPAAPDPSPEAAVALGVAARGTRRTADAGDTHAMEVALATMAADLMVPNWGEGEKRYQ